MRKTSPRGISKDRDTHGYVLVEAIVLLVVVSIGVTAILGSVSAMVNAVHNQSHVTAQIIQERNEQALSHMQDSGQK